MHLYQEYDKPSEVLERYAQLMNEEIGGFGGEEVASSISKKDTKSEVIDLD
jgi:hypothetical protein